MQIVQLRDEMRSEFSATRAEAKARDEETGPVLTEQMDSRCDVLSERMMSLFDANERHMRLLHEDLVRRIATIGDSRS